MPGNTQSHRPKTQEDSSSLWRPTQYHIPAATEDLASTRTPQGMNAGCLRVPEPNSLTASTATQLRLAVGLYTIFLPPREFQQTFPKCLLREPSAGVGGRGTQRSGFRVSPPTEAERLAPELSLAGISDSLTLRSSIPWPPGQEGLRTSCLMTRKQGKNGPWLPGC